MGCITEVTRTLGVDSERLWELLFQRGYKEQEELHVPSFAGFYYLTLFGFAGLFLTLEEIPLDSRTYPLKREGMI